MAEFTSTRDGGAGTGRFSSDSSLLNVPALFNRPQSVDAYGLMSPLIGQQDRENSMEDFPGKSPARFTMNLGSYSPPYYGGGGGGLTPYHSPAFDFNGASDGATLLGEQPFFSEPDSGMAMQADKSGAMFDPKASPPPSHFEQHAFTQPQDASSSCGGLSLSLVPPVALRQQQSGFSCFGPTSMAEMQQLQQQEQEPLWQESLVPKTPAVAVAVKQEQEVVKQQRQETKSTEGVAPMLPESAAVAVKAESKRQVPAAAAGKRNNKKKKPAPEAPEVTQGKLWLLGVLERRGQQLDAVEKHRGLLEKQHGKNVVSILRINLAGLPESVKTEDGSSGEKVIGKYTASQRQARIEAFKKKFERTLGGPARAPKGARYASRQRHARNRKRVGGRFAAKAAKADELDE